MIRITWDSYHAFRCIAAECPDSCCKEWEVDVDEKSANAYRTMPGQLGDKLRRVLSTGEYGSCFTLVDGRCPFWQEDGLCQIQAQCGHEALCQICREYPRLYMDYGDFAEWGLEMSCPESARLLFQGIRVTQEEIPDTVTPEYDRQCMEILQQSRCQLLHFWESSELRVPEKLSVTLLFAHQTQFAIDGGELMALDEAQLLCRAGKYADANAESSAILAFFGSLEILTEQWRAWLASPMGGTWPDMLCRLAVYLIRRYWLQAVWDFDLVCRAKLILSGCIVVNLLGGDPVRAAQLFSREIENDPDNCEAIFNGSYTTPCLTDRYLLGILLGKNHHMQ